MKTHANHYYRNKHFWISVVFYFKIFIIYDDKIYDDIFFQ